MRQRQDQVSAGRQMAHSRARLVARQFPSPFHRILRAKARQRLFCERSMKFYQSLAGRPMPCPRNKVGRKGKLPGAVHKGSFWGKALPPKAGRAASWMAACRALQAR